MFLIAIISIVIALSLYIMCIASSKDDDDMEDKNAKDE